MQSARKTSAVRKKARVLSVTSLAPARSTSEATALRVPPMAPPAESVGPPTDGQGGPVLPASRPARAPLQLHAVPAEKNAAVLTVRRGLADPEGPAAVSFLTLGGYPQPSSSPRGMEEAPACPSTGSPLPRARPADLGSPYRLESHPGAHGAYLIPHGSCAPYTREHACTLANTHTITYTYLGYHKLSHTHTDTQSQTTLSHTHSVTHSYILTHHATPNSYTHSHARNCPTTWNVLSCRGLRHVAQVTTWHHVFLCYLTEEAAQPSRGDSWVQEPNRCTSDP